MRNGLSLKLSKYSFCCINKIIGIVMCLLICVFLFPNISIAEDDDLITITVLTNEIEVGKPITVRYSIDESASDLFAGWYEYSGGMPIQMDDVTDYEGEISFTPNKEGRYSLLIMGTDAQGVSHSCRTPELITKGYDGIIIRYKTSHAYDDIAPGINLVVDYEISGGSGIYTVTTEWNYGVYSMTIGKTYTSVTTEPVISNESSGSTSLNVLKNMDCISCWIHVEDSEGRVGNDGGKLRDGLPEGVIYLGHNGWYKSYQGMTYGDSDGFALIGLNTIDGKTYFFDKEGCLSTSAWISYNDKKYYADESGALCTGWRQIDGTKYYFLADCEMATGFIKDNDVLYFMKSDGALSTGWVEINGLWYYSNSEGVIQTGWLQFGDAWYLLKPDGAMATGLYNNDGTWYYFGVTGTMTTGWQWIDDNWYLFDNSGAMYTGWLQDGEIWYLLQPDGVMATGLCNDNGIRYCFSESGAMLTGWQLIDNNWYLFDDSGAMYTGWLQDEKTWYLLKTNGEMACGWERINDKWYYFSSSGAMVTGWQNIDGVWYNFSDSGTMRTGWYEDKASNWYWFDQSGAMATGWKEINGQWEMFDDNGAWLYTWDGN